MPFKDVPSRVDFCAQERQILELWKDTRAFQTLRELRGHQPRWSFIDGPITANNPMGVHHGWGRTYKDLYHRYWTMRGHRTRYQNGFDCQGLWVEVEVERELGFKSKKDIEDYGLANFVVKCKERVLRYAAVQTEQSLRLGYWMDWDDPDHLRWLAKRLIEDPSEVITVEGTQGPVTGTVEQIVGRLGMPELGHSYFTFSNENNYMIWSFLKKCWQKGWLYHGADVMPWCPRCATAISQHEIVTDGYVEMSHPSLILRFPLRGRENESLLVWTTTPWTLTSNIVAAVGPKLTYVKVKSGDEVFYLSKGTLHMLRGEYDVIAEMKGTELEGWTYDGPFDELEAAQRPSGHTELRELVRGVKQSAAEAHRVILWDEVGETEGTGIVHMATGCGAEDFSLGQELGLPVIAPLDEEGYFVQKFGWLTGKHVSEVASPIFDDLRQKGLLYHAQDYTHRYPVCWRCGTELVFRLVDEWFISMGALYDKPRDQLTDEEKSGSLRYQIMDVVDQIRWIPEFGRAREMDWLRNMRDWMISKKRYWGLCLPIWQCPDCLRFEVIGDGEELRSRAVEGWDVFQGHTPHRPYIDAVKIACPQCGRKMSRILDVGNPWLDAGIVTFSTLRYRSDPRFWRDWYPAHWISESFPGQFRNWFYSLLAMATVIDGSPPFLQNFGYATLLAEDGRPMHKSWGNSIEFNDAADTMGVDVMRWLYCSQKPENNLLFGFGRADQVRRTFLIPLWNVYNFLVTYAKLDAWEPPRQGFSPGVPEGPTPRSDNLLDQWIVALVNRLVARCTEALEKSDVYTATGLVESFLDNLTNWYVRRSRRRFWKSEHDSDKQTAYSTLYYVLVRLIKILAPFTPFVTEAMYQNLVRSVQPDAFQSIHHCEWPQADPSATSEELLAQMAQARLIASLGLSARSSAGIKVRQPLSRAMVYDAGSGGSRISEGLMAIVADELNVKAVEFVEQEADLVTYRLAPDGKLLGPRLGRRFPRVRAALAAADAARVVKQKRAGLPIGLSVDRETIELAPEEVLVGVQPLQGLAVAHDKGLTVAVDVVITPGLRAEGLVRDMVRHLQTLRKTADYRLDQRITVGLFDLSQEARAAVRAFESYLCAETLCTTLLVEDDGGSWDQRKRIRLAGSEIELAVRR